MSDTPLRSLFQDNFLEYASYVIKDRAIPDAADGLKPVQRRILWSLRELDDGRFNKVANVIGHCMRYHPHGDQSIGDALVTLANRGYFIDRQGNFGNMITGDEASAPRYIECRLTDLARETLFDDRVTEFVDSYDGRNREPVLLPAKIPVLLLLGAEGIAVGMSTRILPHNFCEVIQAQIALIRGRRVQLYPDFPQGGSIDVSAWDDGRGRIRNRATIEKRKGLKKLVIREIPWGTTTEGLIASVENAARKGKVKISSIDDFTSGTVEIELTLARGAEPDDTIKQLYAHTDCELTHTSNMVVIRDGTPVEATVTELLQHSTDLLLDILGRELELDLRDLRERLRWMTLEQVFIENRVYKGIEEKSTFEAVQEAVRRGMAAHLEGAELSDADVEKLLAIRIRRISRFDIDAHVAEMGGIRTRIGEIEAHLGDLRRYAAGWLTALLRKYGKPFPRLTRIESLSEIDIKQVSLRNLRVGWDRQAGFVGTAVKGDAVFEASEYDRIAVFHSTGSYRLLPMAEKHFIDGDVAYCGIQDRDRVFTAVYRHMGTRVAYAKRFRIESYIMEKEYAFMPSDAELLVLTDSSSGELEAWFERRKRMRTRKDSVPIIEVPVKGVAARGVRLGGGRAVSSARLILPAEDEPATGPDTPVGEAGGAGGSAPPADSVRDVPEPAAEDHVDPPEPPADQGGIREDPPAMPSRSMEDILRDVETLKERSSEALRKAEDEVQPDLFGG